jgi:hypothetical protein
MAIDIVSIPPMSAEPECLFSRAKQTISDDRYSLSAKTIESIECLKSMTALKAAAQEEH